MEYERILITGANGFVGRHLIRYLLQRAPNCKLVGCIRISELNDAISWAAGRGFDPTRLTWHVVDICDNQEVSSAIKLNRPDCVLHLAARSSGGDIDRQAVLDVNVNGTRYLLEAIGTMPRPASTLLVSTGYVYGNTKSDAPAVETDALAEPGIFGVYTDSKILMESLARPYAEFVTIARPFTHTGPGQAATFVIPSLANQIATMEKQNGPLEIKVGNLEAQRDLLHVEDVVRAYAMLMQQPTSGQTFNVSTGSPRPIREYLGLMLEMTDREFVVSNDPSRMRPADITCSSGNPARIERETGWKPIHTLETTLNSVINYQRSLSCEVQQQL